MKQKKSGRHETMLREGMDSGTNYASTQNPFLAKLWWQQ